MSYGIRIRDGWGVTVFQSDGAQGGVLADVFIPAAGGETRSYPAFAGRNAFVTMANGHANGGMFSVDGSLGYPRVTIPAGMSRFSVMVFVR